MSRNVIFALTFLVLVAMCLAGCTPAASPAPAQPAAATKPAAAPVPASNQAANKEPIKFGIIQPLTGDVADAGTYVVNGAKLAVDYINQKGGICGGRPLEADIQDGKNDPQESANAAELLITRDKVPIIMGAWGSSSTLAVMPVMERHQVPLVVETSSSGKITTSSTPGFKWVHRISPPSQMEADASQGYIVDKLGLKNVAILSVNNDWGRGAAAVFQKAIEDHGGKVISQDFVNSSATDVLPQLTKIKSSTADSLLITTSAGQIATMLKQVKELGMKQTVLTTGGSNFPGEVIQLSSADVAEGSYYLVFFIPDRPDLAGDPALAKMYTDEYAKRKLPDMGIGESYRGFDGVMTIAKGIEANNCSLDPKSLNDALSKVDFKGLSGAVKFVDADGHQSRPNVYLVQVKSGKLTLPDFQFTK